MNDNLIEKSIQNTLQDITLIGSSSFDYLSFWHPIISCIIGLAGLLCNATSILILIKKRYIEETFNFLMTMIFFMDSFAILVVMVFRIPAIFKNHNYSPGYFLWLYPFGNIFIQGSTFMIVSVAFERYFASRNPISTHQIYNGTKNQDQYLTMGSDSAVLEDANQPRKEILFAKVSMGVILIYLTSNIPSSILDMYMVTHLSDMYACKKAEEAYLKLHSHWFIFTCFIFKFLDILNLSTHSVIYIALNKSFRLDFANLFKPWFKKCVVQDTDTDVMDMGSIETYIDTLE